MSPVRQNRPSTASVYFPKNSNLSLTSFTEGTKKQQEEIVKMGEGLKPTQKFKATPSQSLVSGYPPAWYFEKSVYGDYNDIHRNYDVK